MFSLKFNKALFSFVMVKVLLLSSCSLFQHTKYENVNKSPNDKKDYRYLTLANGLKVLLVSDSDADVASASMDVFVGSRDDPSDRPGLAHFAEHMLFLGTKKYPEASAYSSFIKANAGSNNAFTGFEHTNFFFDIRPESLSEALDRFSQFFVAPLFTKHYVEREINAINAEFKAKINDDARRKQDVLKTLVNDKHPWHKFAVGNHDTLSGGDRLLSELKAFYQKYYSAKNMTLVVTGKETLPELEQMVEQYFKQIPGHTVRKQPVKQPLFKKGDLPRWVNIQPVKQIRELTLLFPVPDFTSAYKSKPLMLLGHILGHEGKGSLYAWLKNRNWIESLVAGETLSYSGGGVFSISMNLTDEGLDNQQGIVEAVFQAIHRLKQEGMPRWAFDELSAINNLRFIYPVDSSALNRAIQLSQAMQYYPAKDILQADTLLTEYKPELVKEALSWLTVSNVLVSVMAYGFTYVNSTNFYQVPFTAAGFPEQLKTAINDIGNNPAIVMPSPNNLLPDDMHLPEVTSKQAYPERVLKEKALEVWYKPVVNFPTPRVSNYFGFQKYRGKPDVNSDVALDLYIALINDNLADLLYPAYLAGLDFRIYSHSQGVTLNVEGFSSRQKDLLELIVKQIQQATFNQEQFERIKKGVTRRIGNLQFEQPYRRLLAAWQQEMRPQLWSYEQILKALEDIDLSSVEAARDKFWQGARLTTLTNGDMTKPQAIALARMMQAALQKNGDFATKDSIEVVKLNTASYKYVETPYNDYGYLYYWQAKDNGISTQVSWILLGKLLESGYFHTLRTEQQLGYVVFANYYPLMTVPGIVFVVQSPQSNINRIHESTNDFLNGLFTNMPKLSEVVFNGLREALIEQLSEKPTSLYQETSSYWTDLSLGFAFNRKQQLISSMQGINFKAWKNAMLQSYQLLPQKSLLLGTEKMIDLGPDIKAFKVDSPYHGKYIYTIENM